MGSISRILPQDSQRTHESYTVWPGIMPLPPASLMWSVGGSTLENFLVVADAWDQLMAPFLRPGSTVLEIGCGCGRSARTLLRHPYVARYIGFDVIGDNIRWCSHFLEPLSEGRARFVHYDLYSAEYNPQGAILASELRFPCEDAGAHVVLANSVFTHLLEPDAVHYLEETARTLAPDGHALFSIHIEPAPGQRFSGNETRIDIEPAYFQELASAAGLALKGRRDEFCGQMLFIFSRKR